MEHAQRGDTGVAAGHQQGDGPCDETGPELTPHEEGDTAKPYCGEDGSEDAYILDDFSDEEGAGVS